jgi:hypothetical protein
MLLLGKWFILKLKFKRFVRNLIHTIVDSKPFLAVIMLAIGISWTVNYYEFSDLYQEYDSVLQYLTRSTVEIVNPVYSKTVEEIYIESPVIPKNEEKETDIDFISDKIFGLESSWGKNDGCVRKGEGYNGYGFRQNSREWKCYPSREEARAEVEKWLVKHLAIMPINQAMCFYNTGIKSDTCSYWENYNSLGNKS